MPTTPDPSSFTNSANLNDTNRISRRLFGRRAAFAAALSLSPAEVLAIPHHAHRDAQAIADLTPEQSQEVEAKLANIVRKWGDRLSSEQRNHLRHILSYNERMLASVRSFPLENGDAPASVLRVSFTESTAHANPAHPGLSATEGKS